MTEEEPTEELTALQAFIREAFKEEYHKALSRIILGTEDTLPQGDHVGDHGKLMQSRINSLPDAQMTLTGKLEDPKVDDPEVVVKYRGYYLPAAKTGNRDEQGREEIYCPFCHDIAVIDFDGRVICPTDQAIMEFIRKAGEGIDVSE